MSLLKSSTVPGIGGCATAQIVDTLPQLGGQLTALYPEKYIFDVGGYRQILAKDLVNALADQASQFNFPSYLNQHVTGLEQEDGHLVLVTETDRFPTRAVIIAAGIGAFTPRRLPQPCAEPWYGRGIFENVADPESFRGQRIVIIGGGDSAFDWAHQLRDRAAAVTLVHRSDKYRAHGARCTPPSAGRATYRFMSSDVPSRTPLTGVTLCGCEDQNHSQ
jgi:thioredoxin reductase (NADPH)